MDGRSSLEYLAALCLSVKGVTTEEAARRLYGKPLTRRAFFVLENLRKEGEVERRDGWWFITDKGRQTLLSIYEKLPNLEGRKVSLRKKYRRTVGDLFLLSQDGFRPPGMRKKLRRLKRSGLLKKVLRLRNKNNRVTKKRILTAEGKNLLFTVREMLEQALGLKKQTHIFVHEPTKNSKATEEARFEARGKSL